MDIYRYAFSERRKGERIYTELKATRFTSIKLSNHSTKPDRSDEHPTIH